MVGRAAAGLALVLALVVPATAAAAGPHAELDGRPIALSLVPDFYCHDLAYPIIRCFRTPDALSADLVRGGPHAASATVSTGVAYVTIYQDISLSGPFTTLSQDYDNLGSIGWNDRVSSFKSLNGYGGRFWTDASRSGSSYSFSAGAVVTYVGDAFNDTFSSVYRS